MKTGPILFTLLIFQAAPPIASARTVESMTCLDAQAYVIRHQGYEAGSSGSVVPVSPVIPVNQHCACAAKEHAQYVVERTADMSECLLGYVCVPD